MTKSTAPARGSQSEGSCTCCNGHEGPLVRLPNGLLYCEPCAQSLRSAIGSSAVAKDR